MPEVNYHRVDSGYSTARLSASEQDRLAREQREAAARHYLLRRDLDDVAVILGLAPPPPAPPCTCRRCRAPREDN